MRDPSEIANPEAIAVIRLRIQAELIPMAIEVRVNNKVVGHVKPGDKWTIGSDDTEQRTYWHAIPGNKRKVPLLLFTRPAAEFYVAACAGHVV